MKAHLIAYKGKKLDKNKIVQQIINIIGSVIIIVPYQLTKMFNLLAKRFNWAFDMMIMDEIQHIKSRKAITTLNCEELQKRSKRVIGMSGTS